MGWSGGLSLWLVLMASLDAARSKWVNREVAWWRADKSPQRLLVVLTEGEFTWDEDAGRGGGWGGVGGLSAAWVHGGLSRVFVRTSLPGWAGLAAVLRSGSPPHRSAPHPAPETAGRSWTDPCARAPPSPPAAMRCQAAGCLRRHGRSEEHTVPFVALLIVGLWVYCGTIRYRRRPLGCVLGCTGGASCGPVMGRERPRGPS
jgi:hypothetical protein